MTNLSFLRELLESFNSGAPWVALTPVLLFVARALKDHRVQELFGSKHRPIVLGIVAVIGALWPDLSSGDSSASSALLGALLGVVAVLQGAPPGPKGEEE